MEARNIWPRIGGKVSLSIHIFPGQQLLPYSCSLPPLMSSAVLIFSFSAIANCRAVRPSRVGHCLQEFRSCVAAELIFTYKTETASNHS